MRYLSLSAQVLDLGQDGQISVIQNGALVGTPFLDITSKLESGGEKGLLGLVFHPSFSSNRRFFVYYTRRVNTSSSQCSPSTRLPLRIRT